MITVAQETRRPFRTGVYAALGGERNQRLEGVDALLAVRGPRSLAGACLPARQPYLPP